MPPHPRPWRHSRLFNRSAALIKAIDPKPDDTIVTLGDYINRGIDSKGVIDQLLNLRSCCNLIPILGNHDGTMLEARDDEDAFRFFLEMGGITTLDSYGDTGRLDLVPAEHWEFFKAVAGTTRRQRTFLCMPTTIPPCQLRTKTSSICFGCL